MKKDKFIFFGKILGFYYELNEDYSIKKDSLIIPAQKMIWFKNNARKAYPKTTLIFNKVG